MELPRKVTPKLAQDLVSEFYDSYPYPNDALLESSPLGCNWRWSLEDVYSFCTGATSTINNQFNILDAGCGSGVTTDYLAKLNPGSKILAIDIETTTITTPMTKILH